MDYGGSKRLRGFTRPRALSGFIGLRGFVGLRGLKNSGGCGGLSGSAGSASIEAAIALPVFFLVTLSFVFIIRVVHVREVVGHALTCAAMEIAQSGYLYDVAGLLDIQRDIEGLEGRVKDKAVGFVENAYHLDEMSDDMPDVSGMVGDAIDGAYEGLNGTVFGAFAKETVVKYIRAGAKSAKDGNGLGGGARISTDLDKLSVVDGFEGLDFSNSTFLNNGDENVVIRVAYKMKAPLFLSAVADFTVSQQACAKVWLFGDRREGGQEEASDEDENKDDSTVWSLEPLERGGKIAEVFGANLPANFKTINGFKNGEAFTVKSLDTTADTYQNSAALKRTVNGYINKLASYKGQEKPWNGGGGAPIFITNDQIKSRKIILVIPTNAIPQSTEAAIAECVRAGAAKGVAIQVERYQEKKIPKTHEEQENKMPETREETQINEAA